MGGVDVQVREKLKHEFVDLGEADASHPEYSAESQSGGSKCAEDPGLNYECPVYVDYLRPLCANSGHSWVREEWVASILCSA
jgi:hypothetical protein